MADPLVELAMERTLSRLVEDIISVVQWATKGQWSRAEELHEKVMTQVTSRLGQEEISSDQQKRYRECSRRCSQILASGLTMQGRWEQAETVLRELLQVEQQRLTQVPVEAEVIDLVNGMTHLATLLQKRGKLQEGQQIHRETSKITCEYFGNVHPHTLSTRNNLAVLLSEQGKWQEAEEMHRSVLETRLQVLGKWHADTLSSTSNLALVLRELGRWHEAEEMHREVLEARQRVLGKDHHDRLRSLNNLATVLQERGKWQQAEEMHREALEGMRLVLGPDHQDTLSSMTNLANVLQKQGRWQGAEEMHREVLAARRRLLGEEHPDLLRSLNNLATVLQEQGKWQEAEEMQRQALAGMRRVVGQDHPDTLRSMDHLATVLRELGKWQEAEETHSEVLKARRRLLGEEHPHTLSSMNNLANVLQAEGRWREAEEMHREVLEGRRRVLGEDHPDTLGSMNNLGSVVSARDREDWQFRFSLKDDSHRSRLEDAKEKVRKAIDALKLRVDADHPDLVRRRRLLAELLVQTNEPSSLQEAEDLLRQVVPACSGRYGPEHRWTQEATMNLVFVLEEQGKDAEEWRQHLVPIEQGADSTTVPSTEQNFDDNTFGADREALDDPAWLQDVLQQKLKIMGKQYEFGRLSSNLTNKSAVDGTDAAAASEAGSHAAHATCAGTLEAKETIQNREKMEKESTNRKAQDISETQLSKEKDLEQTNFSQHQKGNVPNPEIREKLLAGCTDNLCFLIRQPEELAKLNLIRDSGFQRQVQEFLVDPDFLWSSLAVVKMPAYQKSAHYGISGHDSDVLGVIVIRSSNGSPLRISVGIWLQKDDFSLIRRIISQVVLQVFGANPMHRNHDVRRNRFTLERVDETTPIEAQITFFQDERPQPEQDLIDLTDALSRHDLKLLQQVFRSSNLKLTGLEKDFVNFAHYVAQRFKSRPQVPKCLKLAKDFVATWLPGNLFKCTISQHLGFLHVPEFRKELDGHIVVLLPSHDRSGELLVRDHVELLVTPVDNRKRGIYKVPRTVLHPLDFDGKEKKLGDVRPLQPPVLKKVSLEPIGRTSPHTYPYPVSLSRLHDKTHLEPLEQYLKGKYKYRVLVKSGETWEEARLCPEVVGAKTCLVEFEYRRMKLVEASDLRLARSLRSPIFLTDGQEAATVAQSAQSANTANTKGTGTGTATGTTGLRSSDFSLSKQP